MEHVEKTGFYVTRSINIEGRVGVGELGQVSIKHIFQVITKHFFAARGPANRGVFVALSLRLLKTLPF